MELLFMKLCFSVHLQVGLLIGFSFFLCWVPDSSHARAVFQRGWVGPGPAGESQAVQKKGDTGTQTQLLLL